jgi:hypothetical protein
MNVCNIDSVDILGHLKIYGPRLNPFDANRCVYYPISLKSVWYHMIL